MPLALSLQDGKMHVTAANPQSAYLGPKLWDKPISLPSLDESEFSIMNIDDFLNENNLSLEDKEDPVMPNNGKDSSPEPMAMESSDKLDLIDELIENHHKMEQQQQVNRPQQQSLKRKLPAPSASATQQSEGKAAQNKSANILPKVIYVFS